MKKKDIVLFIVLFLFTSIIFWGYLTEHFATDTFNITNIGYKDYAVKYSLTDGRIFMGLIGLLASIIKIPILHYITTLTFLAIVVSVINVIILKNIVLQHKTLNSKIENALVILFCYYTIFNYTFIDNMYFVECFVMAVSILFYILAAHKIIRKEEYTKSIMLLFLGIISYQGTISAFFIFILLFSMINNDNFKTTIKKFIISVGIFIIAFLLNSICIYIAENLLGTKQTRGGNSIGSFIINIGFIISNIYNLILYTSNLFPKYLYMLFVGLASIIICCKLVKQNKESYSKKNEKLLLEQYIIIICGIIFAFIPSIYSLSAFESARIRFSLGALIGCMFIHLTVKTDLLKRKTVLDKMLIGIFILYGIINTVNYIYMIQLNKWVNQIDKEKVYEINAYIDKYEKENDLEVNNIKLVVIPRNISKAYYTKMNCTGVGVAVSSVRTEWATQGIINYYTNRNLTKKELKEEEKEKYLKEVEEKTGYLCIDDSLYISVYWY